MITYHYKARDKFGKLVQGNVEAESESALIDQLEQMEYVPIMIKPKKEEIRVNAFFRKLKRGRVTFSDLSMFSRLLFTLQKAGLPLLSSLDAIGNQTFNVFLKDIIREVAKDIEEGKILSKALEKHPHVFNSLYVNMIKSGEVSGRLPEVLERLAILGEYDEVLRMRIKSAIRYPIIVVAAIIIAFLILITFVVPQYESLFRQFDTALPLPTQILLVLNYAITKFWWASIMGIGIFVFLLRKFIRTSQGVLWWNNLQLKIPVFGPLLLKLYMSRFCRISGTLLKSGVPILQILDLVSQGTGNAVVVQAIHHMRASVNEGKGMLGPMKESGLFPPVVTQMVSAGEETGKLDDLLIHVADYYDSQIDYTISNLVSLIEPFLIIILGCAVLLMALGIFMPMWNLMSLFTR